MGSTPSSTPCEPRWATPRTPGRPNRLEQFDWIAKQLGMANMPWQRQVAEVATEMVVDEEASSMLGREIIVPAYPETIITVERQTGKTIIVLEWELDRALLWKGFDDKPQKIAYSAQNGVAARKKFREDQYPLIQRSPLKRKCGKPRWSAEDMSLPFMNGSNLSIWATAKVSGHGDTLDLGVLDEIFSDSDDRREQAFVPAMATRHDRQKVLCSTAEDADGVVLRRKRKAGRRAVDEGRREGVAYFEWSADPNDDPESPETWRRCHPALGHTITERTIRQALEEMRGEDGDLTEFKRAWLNIPVEPATKGDGAFDSAAWGVVCFPDPPSGAPTALVVDVAPEDRWGAIGAASGDVVKLLAHKPGPKLDWLVEMANGLSAELDLPVVFQGKGPAGHLANRFDRPKPLDFDTVANACADFANAVAEKRVKVRDDAALTAAVEGAGRRTVGDRWVWDRRTADVTPLMVVSMAFAEAQNAGTVVPLGAWR